MGSQCHRNALAVGAPLGANNALPNPVAGFDGAASQRGRDGKIGEMSGREGDEGMKGGIEIKEERRGREGSRKWRRI